MTTQNNKNLKKLNNMHCSGAFFGQKIILIERCVVELLIVIIFFCMGKKNDRIADVH